MPRPTDRDIAPYVFHETLVEDHREDLLRSGEGCVAALDDGSLLMVYGVFKGGGDADKADLVERRSDDGGKTWTPRKTIMASPGDSLNIMSVSLLNLRDGHLAMVYLHKKSLGDCRPVFQTSGDGGRSWAEPVTAIDEPAYYVVNNDRLVQLSSGRVLIPFSWHGDELGRAPSVCGCAFSDDLGKTWQLGRDRIGILPKNVKEPKVMEENYAFNLAHIRERNVAVQEPGVVELLDGRVMMWCRTPGGYAYRALSEDGGDTWGPFEAMEDFAMPCGPQSIKRLPGSERLVMLFNDRQEVPIGHSQFGWRRPLTVGVSDDDGATWRRLGLLEPESVPSNCYYSLCFHGENVVFTYYEGVWRTNEAGLVSPRNLTSLKLKIVAREYFDQNPASEDQGGA